MLVFFFGVPVPSHCRTLLQIGESPTYYACMEPLLKHRPKLTSRTRQGLWVHSRDSRATRLHVCCFCFCFVVVVAAFVVVVVVADAAAVPGAVVAGAGAVIVVVCVCVWVLACLLVCLLGCLFVCLLTTDQAPPPSFWLHFSRLASWRLRI